jgi:hypothetical protein
VYWKGFEPSELLDYKSRFVASRQELPFQEGKHLSPITEGDSSTELLEYYHMANNLSNHQVYMASHCNTNHDKLDPEYDDEQLADISADEPTADAPQDEHQRIRRVTNAKRAQRKRNEENRA